MQQSDNAARCTDLADLAAGVSNVWLETTAADLIVNIFGGFHFDFDFDFDSSL